MRIEEAASGHMRRVILVSQTGRILYTQDGKDPRAAGGYAAAGALEYKEPVTLPADGALVARVLSDYGLWSAPVRLNRNLHE